MAESAVASVVRAFGTMAAEEAAFLRGVHTDADLLRGELRRMQCFLRDADARRRGSARVTNWVVDVRAAAYDAEDALEEAAHHALRCSLGLGFAGFLARCAHLFALHRFGVEIRRVRAKIREIADGAAAYGVVDLGDTSAPTDLHEHEVDLQLDWEASLVVGFHEEKHKITKELINPNIKQLSVVSIVGMGGSGKSTLARKIYDFSHVKNHFHAFGWIAVSQKYKFLDLIKEIAKRMMCITRKKIVRVLSDKKDQSKDGTSTTTNTSTGRHGESSHDDGFKRMMGIRRKRIVRDKKDQSKDGTSISTSTSRHGQSSGDDGSHEVAIEELEKMGEEEVQELLHQFLNSRRFLLVLDDVWRSSSYSEINRIMNFMPDVENGSRIMLTTRDMNVAMHVNKRSSIHEMKLLDERQSWELLEKKAFPQYQNVHTSDRSRFIPIGKKLAAKCKGLPLALVVLGGYLFRNFDHDIWSGLVDNLDWETRKDDEPVWNILARSYNDLPNHQFKACFLYVASFPEDHIIRVARLCKLWIAEGLIPQRPNRTMEETGREYINELAQRCMLQAVERSKVHGSIKSVVIHDVLRNWGVAEARREGLFNIWNNPTDCETFSDSIPAYRVALHNFAGHFGIDVTIPKLRTLLVFFKLPTVSALCSLKCLRVLDLYGLKGLKKLPSGIGQLIHLRYLGLQKCGDGPVCIPSSLSDLLNLQTLDARGSTVRSLLPPFWNIPTLRHLYFGEVNIWTPPEIGFLRSLQTLYLCETRLLEDVYSHRLSKHRRIARSVNKSINQKNSKNWAALLEVLEEMEQLVLLHLESWAVYEVFTRKRLQKRKTRIEILSAGLGDRVSGHRQLRVLELAGIWKHGVAELTKLPHGLKKLKLIGSELQEDPMPVLGTLPNLVVLVLEDDAYMPQRNMASMACHADGFPRLQHLTFHGIKHVQSWNVEAGAFPSLTRLNLIFSFRGMALPPPGLLHVTSLQMLHLKPSNECTVSTENVRKLREKGCEVVITSSYEIGSIFS